MKRILTLALATLLTISLAIVASAGAFVASPSGTRAPVLESYYNHSGACRAKLEICSYADRENLSEADCAALEAAYASIVATDDLGELSPELDALARNSFIKSENLAVSELFDISHDEGETHGEHSTFVIKLRINTDGNFFSMIHYTADGWEVIGGSEEGGVVTFEADDLSPFAIVVHKTGSVPNLSFLLIIAIVVVLIGSAVADKKYWF